MTNVKASNFASQTSLSTTDLFPFVRQGSPNTNNKITWADLLLSPVSPETITINGLSATASPGLTLQNTTPGVTTAGLRAQYAPTLNFLGQHYNGASSVIEGYRIRQTSATQALVRPNFLIDYTLDGTTFTNAMSLSYNGVVLAAIIAGWTINPTSGLNGVGGLFTSSGDIQTSAGTLYAGRADIRTTPTVACELYNTQTSTDSFPEQYSPSLRFTGTGSNGIGGASKTYNFDVYLKSQIDSASNDVRLNFDTLVNGATRVTQMQLSLNGSLYLADGLAGTTTNNDATAGNVGEIITATRASGSATPLTTTTAANITSISLTAGDWDVTGIVDYALNGVGTASFVSGSSSTSATLGAQDTFTELPLTLAVFTGNVGQPIPTVRYSLAATTTVYLIGKATFGAGTVGGFGTIRARRVR